MDKKEEKWTGGWGVLDGGGMGHLASNMENNTIWQLDDCYVAITSP